MKRIIIWIFILFTPSVIWFAFTEDGQAAFKIWFTDSDHNSIPNNLSLSEAEKGKSESGKQIKQGQRILIPAHDIHKHKKELQLPFLHVEIKGRNTEYNKVPAGLILIDDKGRRTGYDSINKTYFQEIPNSQYKVKYAERVSPPLEVAVVSIKPLESQFYRIEVIGHRDITYQLSVSRLPSARNRILAAMPRHIIKKEELHSYAVNMSNNPGYGFLGPMARELLTSSFASGRNIKTEALDSDDMKIKKTLPETLLKRLQQKGKTLSYVDTVNGYSLSYRENDAMEENWNGLFFGNAEKAVLTKVLPHKEDAFQYQFNKTLNSLQSFASKTLPRSIGLAADGDGYSIHPVGIFGTKAFTNSNGVEGIQTYLVHTEERYEEGDDKSYSSYELQGPVYLIPLKPDQVVSPVLVVSPAGPMGSNFATNPQLVWNIANSVRLTQ